MTAEKPKENAWSEGNGLYLDCDGGYIGAYICQNSSNYTVKSIHFIVCKL